MKKALLLIVLTAVILVLIAGCTQKQSSTSNVGSAPEASAVAQGGSSQVVNGITAMATQLQVPASESNASNTEKVAAFNCTVKNVNAVLRYVGTEYWTLQSANGTVYYPAAQSYRSNRFGPATTNPGDVVNGIVYFNVPQNAQLRSLTYNDYAFSKITFNL